MLFALFDVVAGELTVDDDVTVTVIVDVVGGGLTARGGGVCRCCLW